MPLLCPSTIQVISRRVASEEHCTISVYGGSSAASPTKRNSPSSWCCMGDWSKLVLCPQCGAANPRDGRSCVRCGEQLQEAIAKAEALRKERAARMMKERRPKGRPNNKPVDELTVGDLERFSVWEYDLANEGKPGRDETWVKPVKSIPVRDLSNRVVGTRVRLANGKDVWAILSNVCLDDPNEAQEFLGVSIERDGEWFYVARYFDSDYEDRGPEQLAAFLGLPVNDVFPITYDISDLAVGDPQVVRGVVRV